MNMNIFRKTRRPSETKKGNLVCTKSEGTPFCIYIRLKTDDTPLLAVLASCPFRFVLLYISPLIRSMSIGACEAQGHEKRSRSWGRHRPVEPPTRRSVAALIATPQQCGTGGTTNNSVFCFLDDGAHNLLMLD